VTEAAHDQLEGGQVDEEQALEGKMVVLIAGNWVRPMFCARMLR